MKKIIPKDLTTMPMTDEDRRLSAMHRAEVQPVLLRRLASEVNKRGKDAASLCRGLGFELADLGSPDLRVSYSQSVQFLRRALALVPEPEFGLALGEATNVVAFGNLGLGMMACAHSHAVMQFLVDMQHTSCSLLTFRIEKHSQRFSMIAGMKFDDVDLEPFLVSAAFSALAGFSRFIAGPHGVPVAVEVAGTRPSYAQAYERVLGCPVAFNRPENRLDFSPVPVSVPTADAFMEANMRSLLSASKKQRPASDVEAVVLQAIRRDPAQLPSLKDIAASMNIGERTLRRRLSAEGISYSVMVAAERRERTLMLVRGSDDPMAKVAAEAGFSDSRSLRRAVKRWTGERPMNIRRSTGNR
jgi:AraC-like DNA-binding protein